jgi:glycosyltransferase involved in cell wall biosynthesis
MVHERRRSYPGYSSHARPIESAGAVLRLLMHTSMEAPNLHLWRSSAAAPEPPVPQWICDIWLAHGKPRLRGTSNSRYPADAQALLWFVVSDWYRKRRGYRFVLPPELVDWLNTLELDLSEFSYRPGMNGPIATPEPKPVTRLMYSIAEQHGRLSDFVCGERYYQFLAWYALELIPEWNLPGSLLPQAIIDLLNAPAGDDATLLTVGMWLHLRSLGLAAAETDWSDNSPSILATSFLGLDSLLSKGDPRLIPPTVSHFWSQRPLENGIVTAFEYVLARTRSAPGATDPIDEAALRDWYHREILTVSDGAYGLFSSSPTLAPSTKDEVTWAIRDTAVLIYRDHDVVAGLSLAGIRARDALLHGGVPTFDIHFNLGRARLNEEVERNRGVWVNARRKLHLINVNPEYVPDCCYCNLAHIGAQDYVVGQFYWELSRISRVHEPGIAIADEIWTASEYLNGIYSAETDRPVITMGQAIVPLESVVTSDRRQYGIGDETFVFLSNFDAGSVVERKNPLGVIIAFQGAFPLGTEDVSLVIKTRNLENLQTVRDREHWALAVDRIAKDSRIIVITETVSAEAIAGLYCMSDCFVSLHRSEGFGFGPAEAMAHGKPVIVTNYSGVCDFCTEETAMLVGYDLIRVKPNEYPYLDADRVYRWADPDLNAAAAHMAELAGNRARAAKLGSAAKDLISRKFSLTALNSRYMDRLRHLGFA